MISWEEMQTVLIVHTLTLQPATRQAIVLYRRGMAGTFKTTTLIMTSVEMACFGLLSLSVGLGPGLSLSLSLSPSLGLSLGLGLSPSLSLSLSPALSLSLSMS